MFHHFRLPALIAAVFLAAPATSGTAAEIKVLDANALTIAMKEIAADFTKETGNQVTFVGVNPGQVEQRIKAGEMYDLVVTAAESAQAFEKEGKWRPGTLHPLARVGIGVAVGLSAPQPNIFSVENFRQTLLRARRIAYADPTTGAMGALSVTAIIQALGISSQIARRTALVRSGLPAELVARGEADIALQPASELRLVPSVRFAGLVPAPVQVFTTYTGAISTGTRQQEAAIALMSALADPGMEPLLRRRGMEMP
jgi:molybdate transport system substrate-binding protein